MKFLSRYGMWVVLAVALILRIPHLNGSFWLDEAAQALESTRPLSQQLQLEYDFQPPLLHLLVHGAAYVSHTEWWLRTVGALLPGLITVWATYQIGVKLGGRRVGLTAALLLATSSFHLFYSQELRPYSLPTLWAVLSWGVLLGSRVGRENRKVSLPAGRQGKQAKSLKEMLTQSNLLSGFPVLQFTCFTILGLYSSYLYPFLVVSQALYVFLCRREWMFKMFVSLSLAAVAFLPWIPSFLGQLRAGGLVRTGLPGWEEVVSVPQLKSLPLVFGKFVFGVLDLELNMRFLGAMVVVLFVAGASTWQLARYKNKHTQTMNSLTPLLLWLVVPLITSWIVSFWIPVVQPKRVLFLLPAFYLAVAVMTQELKKKWPLAPLVCVLLALNLFSTWQYYTQPKYQREDWRGLQHQLQARYPQDQTIVVFAFNGSFASWEWYDRGGYPTLDLGVLAVKDVPDLSERFKKITEYRYVAVFDYLRDLSDPEDKVLQEVVKFGYKPIESIDAPNIGFVRVYGKPAALLSQESEL